MSANVRAHVRRLAVFSHVCHYTRGTEVYAYAPYARELTQWGRLFPELVIAAPIAHDCDPIPGDCERIGGEIETVELPDVGGTGVLAKVVSAPRVLVAALRILRVGRHADAVHVRCPGGIGALAAALTPLVCSRRIAKFAGAWQARGTAARGTVDLQQRLLRSSWWGAPVMVYDRCADDPAHVVRCFTSVMTEDQVQAAMQTAQSRVSWAQRRILFVGRLTENKNVATLLRACASLTGMWTLTVAGDGPLRTQLDDIVRELGCEDRVKFCGAVSFDQVLQLYTQHDILVLASETEGWPKAIAEAMAHGLLCIGSERGVVGEMLADGRGFLTASGDVTALAKALAMTDLPADCARKMSLAAAEWASRYSLENLQARIRSLCQDAWKNG